ncbi:hypothetical protein AB4037_08535 [Labrys sp. KB_33_2]|uniref:hypothetical protein n=1 Tax=Labrys sp. KB_33_2 TaxID=3237479 RepID=UPI003F8FCD8F
MWIDTKTGEIYLGDCQPGDRDAAADEIAAWEGRKATPEAVRAECAWRIYAAASQATQANLNGYINLLNAKALQGGTLTDAQKSDLITFAAAMDWINAMRGACAGLIGNAAYRDDGNWPSLSPELAAFAARF